MQKTTVVKQQEPQPAALTPPTANGKGCGRCGGQLFTNTDNEVQCWQCARLSTINKAQTADEVRAKVRRELMQLARGLDPVVFWSKYITLTELSEIVGMHVVNLRHYMKREDFPIEHRKHPTTGKRTGFTTIDTAKAVIRARE